jgi:hypothetical protein
MVDAGLSLSWWIGVVELPVFAGMFWIFKNNIDYLEKCIRANEIAAKKEIIGLVEAMSEFRVDVAVNYASISYMKDVENRLTAHLLRIEDKISGGKLL